MSTASNNREVKVGQTWLSGKDKIKITGLSGDYAEVDYYWSGLLSAHGIELLIEGILKTWTLHGSPTERMNRTIVCDCSARDLVHKGHSCGYVTPPKINNECASKKCCERDHNSDGNCDRHRASNTDSSHTVPPKGGVSYRGAKTYRGSLGRNP